MDGDILEKIPYKDDPLIGSLYASIKLGSDEFAEEFTKKILLKKNKEYIQKFIEDLTSTEKLTEKTKSTIKVIEERFL